MRSRPTQLVGSARRLVRVRRLNPALLPPDRQPAAHAARQQTGTPTICVSCCVRPTRTSSAKRTVVQWDMGALLRRRHAADEFNVSAGWYNPYNRHNAFGSRCFRSPHRSHGFFGGSTLAGKENVERPSRFPKGRPTASVPIARLLSPS